ncbi:probable ascorbate-specific transmembrane electron transporter 1 [Zingiber officinale]|uniref:probable ascorbate-specific transmembrane electron transporter 1 n=1 Tax=Zingiber officinale TaxID=94328 RepID=UPI001C4BEB36|nr:probable ascorbate-specific transmembrane electron transporter 1 [Zingiber officinale]
MGVPAETTAKSKAFFFTAQVLAAAAAVLVLVWCIHLRGGLAFQSAGDKSLIFNVHPVLMLIGFIIMGSEATMCFRALPWSKQVNKCIHLILHGLALVLGAVGISAAFKFHNELGISNLYSLHSWLGLGTISLYGIQWILGFVTFLFPGASGSLKATFLPWHAVFGVFVYLLGIVSAELGFLEKLTFLETFGTVNRFSGEAFLVNCTALAVLLLGVSVVLSLIASHLESTKVYSAD